MNIIKELNTNKDNDWKSIKFGNSNELQLFAIFTAYRNNDGIPTDEDLKEEKYIIHKIRNKRRKVCEGKRYDIFADKRNTNDKSVEEYEWCCGIDTGARMIACGSSVMEHSGCVESGVFHHISPPPLVDKDGFISPREKKLEKWK